ncbi:hypothetical protein PspLS_07282 [Pyricularia sp. CBS 133598]|nr:hypothetical protein PspLS_07282 [Pyricularia sp. CBS 133598]
MESRQFSTGGIRFLDAHIKPYPGYPWYRSPPLLGPPEIRSIHARWCPPAVAPVTQTAWWCRAPVAITGRVAEPGAADT